MGAHGVFYADFVDGVEFLFADDGFEKGEGVDGSLFGGEVGDEGGDFVFGVVHEETEGAGVDADED